MYKAIVILLSLGVVLCLLIIIQIKQQLAIQDATHKAQIRLLADYHNHFIRSAHVSQQDYLDTLKQYSSEHPHLLDDYIRAFGIEVDRSKERQDQR